MATADESQPLLANEKAGDANAGAGYSSIGEDVKQEQPQPATGPANQNGPPTENVSKLKVCMGICLVILSGLIFTAGNVIQKIVAPNINFWHLLLYRAVVQMTLMLPAVFVVKTSLVPGQFGSSIRTRVFFQGVFGGFLLLSIFVAITHVPLGSSSAIFFCAPVFTFFLATLMLNEPMGLLRGAISVFMVMGVVLITRPPFVFGHEDSEDSGDENTEPPEERHPVSYYVLGYVSAVMVPFLSAIVSILTRQCRHIYPQVLMFWFAAGTFFVGAFGIVFTRSSDMFNYDLNSWLCILAIIILGMLGNVCYTVAVRWVSPSKANVFRSFEVILNYGLQLALEHTAFHVSSLFSIAMLLIAVVATGFESDIMKRYKRTYSFL